jgi:PKD repeat protein
MHKVLFLLFVLLFTFKVTAQNAQQHQHDDIVHLNEFTVPGVNHYELIDYDNSRMRSELNFRSKGLVFVLPRGESKKIRVSLDKSIVTDSEYVYQLASDKNLRKNVDSQRFTLKGSVYNGGHIRLTVNENFTYGYFEIDDERWYIEPAWYYSEDRTPNDKIIIYKESDIDKNHGGTCGAMELHARSKKLESQHIAELEGVRRFGNCYEVELAIASDYSMFQKYGSTTGVEDHNIAIINNVNGVYTGNFDDDIQFSIVTQFVSDCNSCDPWPSGNSSLALLNSFTDWGNNGNFGVSFDLGELWSDRDFDGPTGDAIGVAWLNGLCTNLRYHVLQDFNSNAGLLLTLTAHEIGHNFSAEHDDPGDPYIMAPSVSITSDWSSMSMSDISGFINLKAQQGGCFSSCPTGAVPVVNVEALFTDLCTGSSVQFYDRSTENPFIWDWQFPGGSPGFSNDPNPSVVYDLPGTYSVTLSVTNSAGTSNETFINYISVGNSGQTLIEYQDFDNGPQDWTVWNPDNSITWDIVQVNGGPTGEQAARLRNAAYANNGTRDGLISPVMNLVGYQSAFIEVDYAYARRGSAPSDSLIIYVSTDGGQTFPNRVYANADNGSGNFTTSNPTSGEFIPTVAEHWCGSGTGASCLMVNISSYTGERDVVLMFENYCNTGNNLYLDRIAVLGDCYDLDPPIADFLSDIQESCAPAIVQFTDISENSPYSWQWTFEGGSPSSSDEQNPEVIYTTPGVYNVTLQVENEEGIDILTKTQYITVNDVPLTSFSFSRDSLTVTFNNITQDANMYSWDFGDGNSSTETNPVHTYTDDGDYEVSLTATNDCGSASFNLTIEVQNLPLAGLSQGSTEGCSPFSVQFVNGSSSNTSSVYWIFDGGDPSTSELENPLVTYDSTGSYDVTLIATNDIGSDTIYLPDYIEVSERPEASFEVNVADQTVNFLNESIDGDTYLWHFGDGDTSVLEFPTHLYMFAGNYLATLFATNDCGTDTFSLDINVGGLPGAGIDFTTSEVCLPEEVQFFNASSGTPTAFQWIFEGGTPSSSTDENPLITYTNPGFYDVTLIVENAIGTDTLYLPHLITVVAQPLAMFSYSPIGLSIEFNNESSHAEDYSWDFGDGNTSTQSNPIHTYSVSGIYDVTLISSNICGSDTTILSVGAGSVPLANFGLSDSEVCLPAIVQFSNLSSGDQNTYNWTFEGGDPNVSTAEAPMVTYNQAGVYDVSLIVTNPLGSDTLNEMDFITVVGPPEASFNTVNDNDIIYLENQSIGAFTYKWFVDDMFSSTQELDTIYDLDIGFHDITLIAIGDCGVDTITQTVEIMASETRWENNSLNFDIIPNPNNGQFTTDFGQLLKGQLILVDITGKIIRRFDLDEPTETFRIEEKGLADGVYLLKLVSGDKVGIKRIVVN